MENRKYHINHVFIIIINKNNTFKCIDWNGHLEPLSRCLIRRIQKVNLKNI